MSLTDSPGLPPFHLETPSVEGGQQAPSWYRMGIFLGGLLVLALGTALWPPGMAWLGIGVGAALFITLQSLFPVRLLGREHNLTPALAIGTGLLAGPGMAGWSAAVGILLGYSVRRSRLGRLFPGSLLGRALTARFSWRAVAFEVGALNLALALTFVSLGRQGNEAIAPGMNATRGWYLAGQAALFVLIYSLLTVLGAISRGRMPTKALVRDLTPLALMQILPLPFLVVMMRSFPSAGVDAPLTFGVIATIVMVLIYSVQAARGELEKRLKELGTLNEIGQALRSSLELENLLAELQLQIRQHLRVGNFYVALYDHEQERIWYPLAVKRGQQVIWMARPVTDRLTDRVIKESKAILIPHHAAHELPRIGLPVGEEPPFAWLGVPLISSDRTIGCLAVFSYSETVAFGDADAEYLEMISGEVSAAIENVLLHEQLNRGQAQISQVNQITALLTGSHNPQEVLAQVCQSVEEVCSGARSAIYLTSPEESDVWLAHAHSLSDDFVHANQRFSLAQDSRARCLLTGQPTLIRELAGADLDASYLDLLRREGIVAFADYPLITPEGQIGYLTVYFDAPFEVDRNVNGLLEVFAAQAALAISSARLHARSDSVLARRANQLSILESVGRELSAETRADKLFETILDYALEFTHSAWGLLSLFDPSNQVLVTKAARGYRLPVEALPVERGVSGKALRELRVINVPDVSKDPDYLDLAEGQARSQLCVPLHNQEKVLGVLAMESERVGGYSLTDELFIHQLANQATVALVNAELYGEMADVRERLRAVINSVREGILMVDLDGRVLLVNEFIERLSGIPAEAVVGKLLDELPAEFLESCGYSLNEAQGVLAGMRRGEEPSIPRTAIKRQDGASESVFERFGMAVWGHDGRKTGWMILLRDVTEEFQHTKERQLLTETLVHDLRSPMGTVLGALDVIEEVARSQTTEGHNLSLQAVNVARRGAQRVLGLIDAVLEIARMEAGGVEAELSWLALSEVIAGVLSEYLPQAEEYGIGLEAEETGPLPVIYSDRGKISRVVANLVDNAIKFTPPGGMVKVLCRPIPEQQVMVQVSDTGPGVPEEYREVIYERFKQVPGRAGRRRGSGLGLTFCKLAIETLGGRIWYEPAPSGGSVFNFTLPVASPTKSKSGRD